MSVYERISLRRRRLRRWVADSPHASRPSWAFRPEHALLGLLTIAALAVRLYGLGQRHIIFDESVILDPDALTLGFFAYAQKLWTETTYNPGWPMLVWLISRVAGLSVFWARIPSALCGGLTPLAFYALARQVGLSVRSALLASAVLAFGIFQLEYGQQIMPHAALPLGCCVCLWLASRLGDPEQRANPRRLLMLLGGFVSAFGLLMLLHNSSLLLIPLLLFYLGWNAWRPVGPLAEAARGQRGTALLGCVVCATILGFVSLGWFLAKVGSSDWRHLRPFFASTFRDATDRTILSDMLFQMDDVYCAATDPPATPLGKLRDTGYFAATRTLDLVFKQFRLLGEQQFTQRGWRWLVPCGMVFLVGRGVVRALRREPNRPAARWILAALGLLGLSLVLSAYRVFPLGGIRHLIVLSPLVVLAAAVGLETSSRYGRYALASLCVVWLAGDFMSMHRFYRRAEDSVGEAGFRAMAARYGVHDFVAADTICSEGSLRLLTRDIPHARTIPADDPEFAALTRAHKPFFLCALHDPILADGRNNHVPPVPGERLSDLADPGASLRLYRSTAVRIPHSPGYWLSWTIYLMEPRPGSRGPEVTSVAQVDSPEPNAPVAFLVRFSQRIRPETLNSDTVQLAPAGVSSPRFMPLDIHYVEACNTLTITPLDPLAPRPHVLALYPAITGRDGRALATDGKAAYYHFAPVSPSVGRSTRVDRGWELQAERHGRGRK